MQAIGAACRRTFTAAHDSGPRPTSRIKWIVLHSTEGDTAAGAASWFANPASSGSAHLVVDDNECFRTVEDGRTPWAAHGANENGLHVEQAGYAAWSEKKWRARDITIRRAAYKSAVWSREYGIPLRWVGWAGLKLGRKGVTTHLDCSKAFPPNDGHHDPGSGYPKALFMSYAKMYAKQLGSA